MNGQRSPEYLEGLLREAHMCFAVNETEWVEFKEDNTDPQEIGEYLSSCINFCLTVALKIPYCYTSVYCL